MAILVNSIRAVGVTFECRQLRIEALEDGAPVFFKPEPHNTYDPLAIGIVNEAGEHLGYIGRNDPRREDVRRALGEGFVVARAQKVGGFTTRDGRKASLGLSVQWYAVDPMFGFDGKDEELEVNAVLVKHGKRPVNRYELDKAHKGKELRKNLALGNVERDRGGLRKAGNRKRRNEFKKGGDIKPSQMREDSRYYHFIQCGEWKPFGTFSVPYWKECAPRRNQYISEEEAIARYA